MKKILIVDDQPIIREMIHLALHDSFELETASNADQAYEQIMIAIPDAIVLDVMMPGTMDGYQLCENIKKDPKLAGILVVLITACGQVADQELGRTFGADAYFVKPFSPLQLERYLRDVLLAGQVRQITTGKNCEYTEQSTYLPQTPNYSVGTDRSDGKPDQYTTQQQ